MLENFDVWAGRKKHRGGGAAGHLLTQSGEGGNTTERLPERAQTKVLPVSAVDESCLQVEEHRIILNSLMF